MSASSVHYEFDDGIAVIRLDDGKRNALSPRVLRDLGQALDRAEADRAIVILTGRDEVFSAGFDLKVMKSGGTDTLRMLGAGYRLSARVLGHPYPVIGACNGHVLAMGVFLLLACDYSIGCKGDFKVAANEVALGLTMPRAGAAMLRHRLTPAAFQRAVLLSEYFPPAAAREAGFFDELVEPGALMQRARTLAAEFAKLDLRAHAESKQRIRGNLIRQIRRGVPLDLADALRVALRGGKPRSKVGAA